mgnify:CR=1 FL=1
MKITVGIPAYNEEENIAKIDLSHPITHLAYWGLRVPELLPR